MARDWPGDWAEQHGEPTAGIGEPEQQERPARGDEQRAMERSNGHLLVSGQTAPAAVAHLFLIRAQPTRGWLGFNMSWTEHHY
jgi:hypothetical protein